MAREQTRDTHRAGDGERFIELHAAEQATSRANPIVKCLAMSAVRVVRSTINVAALLLLVPMLRFRKPSRIFDPASSPSCITLSAGLQ